VAVRDILTRVISAGRVPQALLLAGPTGVGKFASALAIASAVNCGSAQDGVPCGACRSCERIAAGQFSDVVVVSRGDLASISIKVVREKILAVIGYRPFEGRRRVFIVDDADDLTWEAQDSLLKTLEEPPPAAILILVTSAPDSLRATVLSRCRRLRFSTLTDQEVASVLVEEHGMDVATARSRAAVAGGSVSQALAIDAGSLEDDRDAAFGVLQAASSAAVGPKLKAATAFVTHEKKRRSREAVGARLDHLASLLRDLTLLVEGRQGDASAFPDLADALSGLARQWTPERLLQAFAHVARARNALDRNASPKIVADWVAVQL
jgi:DNA polymerase-3 subunit delta'